MNFWTQERITTLSTEILLSNMCDFSAQAARTKNPENAARNKEIIEMIKAEILAR